MTTGGKIGSRGDARTWLPASKLFYRLDNAAGKFVTYGDRRCRLEFIEINVQVGAANPRRIHFDHHFFRACNRRGQLFDTYVSNSAGKLSNGKHFQTETKYMLFLGT